jgi:hypothetical protein
LVSKPSSLLEMFPSNIKKNTDYNVKT